MEFEDKDKEDLDRYAASQVMKEIARAYIKTIYMGLPKHLLLKYVTEAFVWYLEAADHSVDKAIEMMKECEPKIKAKHQENESKRVESLQKMIKNLGKDGADLDLFLPDLDKKKESGTN